MNEDDYPKFPEFNPDKQIVLEDEKIKELIKKTIFSCSTDEARPLFTGILVEISDGKITFVGTNTHRLAIKSMPYASDEDMSIHYSFQGSVGNCPQPEQRHSAGD